MSGAFENLKVGDERKLYGFTAVHLSDDRFGLTVQRGYGYTSLRFLYKEISSAAKDLGEGICTQRSGMNINVYVNGKPDLGVKGSRVISIRSTDVREGGYLSFIIDLSYKELLDTILYRVLTKEGGNFRWKIADLWGLSSKSEEFKKRIEELTPNRDKKNLGAE